MRSIVFSKALFLLTISINCCFLLSCAITQEEQTPPLPASTTTAQMTVSPTQKPTESQTNQITGRKDRLSSPDWIECPRNSLTSFAGKIISLKRDKKSLTIEMETDEDTKEKFTISYSGQDKEIGKLRLRGENFKLNDWKMIESGKGRLRPETRAVVWACYDDKNNLKVEAVDWRPPQQK